ncbi:mitochondrial ribosomal subunit S27-domain-containing protein [Melanogaster broomeanus]|nr:mitochondrial ribosomal subunit S27-domain-containing protein [Melanogaster broomeanus]
MAAAAFAFRGLTALTRTRCAIFQTAYNPTSARTGAKYLRARLRGPSMVKYYPEDIKLSMSKLARRHPELELVNFAEAQRLRDVQAKKARGKGVPTKAKDKSLSIFPWSLGLLLKSSLAQSRRSHRKR